MRIKKTDFLVVSLSLLSFIGLALIIYPRLPETIPVHWNYKSQVDGWGPRWTLLILGALPLAIYLLMKGLPHIDPHKEAYKKHEKPYLLLSALIALFMIPIAWIAGLAALGVGIDVGILVRLLVGLLFIALGNFMGKFRPNYFVGIRTPWTLADPEVWRKTHRRGVWVFIIMGSLMLLSLATPHSILGFILVVTSIFGGVIYIFVYSYMEYRKK